MNALRSSTTPKRRRIADDSPGTPTPKRRLIASNPTPATPTKRRSPRNFPSRLLIDIDELEQTDLKDGDDDEDDYSPMMAECVRVSHRSDNDDDDDDIFMTGT